MTQKELEETVFEPILKIAKEFIDNENNIKIVDSNLTTSSNIILPNDTIYFKSQSQTFDLLFCIWYDNKLQDKLMRELNFGEILPEEEAELRFDTAKEVGNIIFGNAISYFLVQHRDTTLSTPIVLDKEISINKSESTKVLQTLLLTKFGEMTISIIAPQSALFMDYH